MKTRLPILAVAIALMPALCSALDLTGLNSVTGAQSSAAGSQNAVPGQVAWASGYQNSVSGNFNNVFGYQNQTIAGNLGSNFVNGASNVVGGYGNAVFGNNNQTANGSIANLLTGYANVGNGAFCMIGGLQNLVTARQSLVFGSFSNDNTLNGSVMFSDHNTLGIRTATNRFTSAGTDTFNARFNQGYYIRTNDGQGASPNAGVFILPSVANTVTTSSPAFVGINTATPTQALDVVGNGAFTGTVSTNSITALGSGQLRITSPSNSFTLIGATSEVQITTANFGAFGPIRASAFNVSSDRNLKKDIESVDSNEILEKLADLPITSWNWKSGDGFRHIGPMAQDWAASFGYGAGDKSISLSDSQGVALVAIKGLNEKLQKEVETLNQAANAKDKRIESMEARLDQLEKLIEKPAAD